MELNRNNLILLGLLTINMIFVGIAGFLFWKDHQKQEAALKIQEPTVAVSAALEKNPTENTGDSSFTQKVVRFEQIIINLNGDNGRRILRLSFEAKVSGEGVLKDLQQFKPQIRDGVLAIISDSSADVVSSNAGKDELKEKIKQTINHWLTHGKASEVYLTEFELN